MIILLSDKEKLKLINFWFSGSKFENYLKLPENGKFTIDDKKQILTEIKLSGNIYPRDITDYRDYLIKKTYESKKIAFTRISLILSVLAIIISVATFILTIPYLQTTLPELSLVSPAEPLLLSAQKMSDPGYVGERIEIGAIPWENVEVCLKNIGRTDSGHVTIRIKNDFLNEYIVNLDNVESGKKPICGNLLIRQKTCLADLEGCKPELLPKGNFKLQLEIDCFNCEPRIISQEIDACIWGVSSLNCD